MIFKLYPEFIRHPKTLRATDILGGGKRNRGRVVAVYAEAGAYASEHLTSGFVPRLAVKEFVTDPKPVDVMDAMLDSNLFESASDGYAFHDWDHWQPDAETTKDQRSANATTRAIFKVPDLVKQVQVRDVSRCRFCGRVVNWHDRRSDGGATYTYVDLEAGATLDNVVVCCNRCKRQKGTRSLIEAGLHLLPAGQLNGEQAVIDLVPIQIELVPLKQIGPGSDLPIPIPSQSLDPRSKAGEHPARKPRMARVPYSVWEVRTNLLAACHRMFKQGPPYTFTTPSGEDFNLSLVSGELIDIAVKLHATWDHGRELQSIVDAAWARHKQQLTAGAMRTNFRRREVEALRKLGRFR